MRNGEMRVARFTLRRVRGASSAWRWGPGCCEAEEEEEFVWDLGLLMALRTHVKPGDAGVSKEAFAWLTRGKQAAL